MWYQMQRSTHSMLLAMTILLQKHAVISLERHSFCIALYSGQISNFKDHIEQHNDQPFPEALYSSRLNAFLFSINFPFKHNQEVAPYFIYDICCLFLSKIQSYFLSITVMCMMTINQSL